MLGMRKKVREVGVEGESRRKNGRKREKVIGLVVGGVCVWGYII